MHFETLKLRLPVLQISAGSICLASFWPWDLRLSSFLFPISHKNPSLGVCGFCWSSIWSLLPIFLFSDILVKVPHMPSPSFCPAQHSDICLWPGQAHRVPKVILTCARRSRFSPQLGAAIVSRAWKQLPLGMESLLTHKHHGTISHSIPSLEGPPNNHLGLLDTWTFSTLLSSLSFPSSGIFSKPPCISTHAGRCFGGVIRVYLNRLPEASKFYLLSSPNTLWQTEEKPRRLRDVKESSRCHLFILWIFMKYLLSRNWGCDTKQDIHRLSFHGTYILMVGGDPINK